MIKFHRKDMTALFLCESLTYERKPRNIFDKVFKNVKSFDPSFIWKKCIIECKKKLIYGTQEETKIIIEQMIKEKLVSHPKYKEKDMYTYGETFYDMCVLLEKDNNLIGLTPAEIYSFSRFKQNEKKKEEAFLKEYKRIIALKNGEIKPKKEKLKVEERG